MRSTPVSKLEQDPCFGAVARALEPRGIADARAQRDVRSEVVAVACRTAALASIDRALFDELVRGDARTAHGEARNEQIRELGSTFAREVVLVCQRAHLLALAEDRPAAAAILAAHDHVSLPPSAPRIMGVLNVTPDSFSDGGRFFDPARAIEHGLELAEQGADLLDVGGESTRPGAEPVAEAEELRRVVPVIEGLARKTHARISIDTRKAGVARAALDAGATIVNDVSAGRFDAAMLGLVALRGSDFIAMHMQGEPRDMQIDPRYGDAVADVLAFLRERVHACSQAGIDRARIAIDPGIGFGKRVEHNLALVRRLSELRSLGLPVCLGVSRKSFLARLYEGGGGLAAARTVLAGTERTGATAAAVAIGVLGGAEILRVHDVAVMSEAARIAFAFASAR